MTPIHYSSIKWGNPAAALALWSATLHAIDDGRRPPLLRFGGASWTLRSCALYGDYAICSCEMIERAGVPVLGTDDFRAGRVPGGDEKGRAIIPQEIEAGGDDV